MILDISCESYQKMDIENFPKDFIDNVHEKNFERVLRLRNIIKNKEDNMKDVIGFENPRRYKEEQNEINNNPDLRRTLSHLGPPKFLRTNFHDHTIKRFTMVNGNFFGCSALNQIIQKKVDNHKEYK